MRYVEIPKVQGLSYIGDHVGVPYLWETTMPIFNRI